MSPSPVIIWLTPVVNTPTPALFPTSIVVPDGIWTVEASKPDAYEPLENIPTELSPTFIFAFPDNSTVFP